jgi:hypothetical protein
MERAGRFLWLPWAAGRVRCNCSSPGGQVAYWEGEHDGFRRLKAPVRHRRGILRVGTGWWLVLDRMESEGEHDYRLHWLFPEVQHRWEPRAQRLSLEFDSFSFHVLLATRDAAAASSLVQASQASPRGWRAPYYFERIPALSLELAAHGALADMWSLLGTGVGSIDATEGRLDVRAGEWEAVLTTGSGATAPLLTEVTLTGSMHDKLDLAVCACC